MKVFCRIALFLLLPSLIAVLPAHVSSQTSTGSPQPSPAANLLIQTVKALYEGIKRNVVESAELLPEVDYSFKPTPEVRSYGEIIGHIANAHYRLCAGVKEEQSPNTADLEKLTTKDDFVKAIKESYDYCDTAFEGMTDGKAMELIKVGTSEVPRVRNLIRVVAHDEHEYGKLVTYLRLKGHVPPSTARRQR